MEGVCIRAPFDIGVSQNGAGGARATWTGSPEGELAGASESNALQFQPVKIDLHTHILPRDWPDLDAKYGYGGFVRLDHYKPCCARMMVGDRLFREISDNVWEPTRRIEEMDGKGISMQVLSTVPVMFSY